jgi:hypothetical protein
VIEAWHGRRGHLWSPSPVLPRMLRPTRSASWIGWARSKMESDGTGGTAITPPLVAVDSLTRPIQHIDSVVVSAWGSRGSGTWTADLDHDPGDCVPFRPGGGTPGSAPGGGLLCRTPPCTSRCWSSRSC